jgi:hypothetical protein
MMVTSDSLCEIMILGKDGAILTGREANGSNPMVLKRVKGALEVYYIPFWLGSR